MECKKSLVVIQGAAERSTHFQIGFISEFNEILIPIKLPCLPIERPFMIVVKFLFESVGLAVKMELYSNVQRSFIVETYFKNNNSIVITQRLFRRHFQLNRRDPIPDRKTIGKWIHKFRQTASVLKEKPRGRDRSVRTAENAERVRESVLRSPTRSARRQSTGLNISDRSYRRMLKELHFHPYKIQVVQALLPRDAGIRVDFCERFGRMIDEDPDILNRLMISDEAHFHLSGFVNKQNFRYWATENPQQLHEEPLHSQKVTVWCAVSAFGIFGPFFFEENGLSVTVTAQRYQQVLENLDQQLREAGVDIQRIWFQQDGATCHTARDSMAILRGMFPGRLISKFGDLNWPARSPDLSACDFFLWGYLKTKVFANPPHTLDELKDSIRRHIAEIPLEMLRKVMQNFRSRLQECQQRGGGHLVDVIFKK